MASAEPICKNLKYRKVVYWSKIDRNAIESDFRASKMATGGHFVDNKLQKKKFRIGQKLYQTLFVIIQNG